MSSFVLATWAYKKLTCILQVADQIGSTGGDTAAVVLVLTDGEWQDVDTSQEQVNNQSNMNMNQSLHEYTRGGGQESHKSNNISAYLQAQNLRKSGARVFGIGVGGSVDEQQVNNKLENECPCNCKQQLKDENACN